MDKLNIKNTDSTPNINLDHEQGTLSIKGISCPENGLSFYTPMLDWVKQYNESPQQKTTLNIEIIYMNTSSAKMVVNVLREFEKLHHSGKELNVNWLYEATDEDNEELGEELNDLMDYQIKLCPK